MGDESGSLLQMWSIKAEPILRGIGQYMRTGLLVSSISG